MAWLSAVLVVVDVLPYASLSLSLLSASYGIIVGVWCGLTYKYTSQPRTRSAVLISAQNDNDLNQSLVFEIHNKVDNVLGIITVVRLRNHGIFILQRVALWGVFASGVFTIILGNNEDKDSGKVCVSTIYLFCQQLSRDKVSVSYGKRAADLECWVVINITPLRFMSVLYIDML